MEKSVMEKIENVTTGKFRTIWYSHHYEVQFCGYTGAGETELDALIDCCQKLRQDKLGDEALKRKKQ
jgi:hypothetical protein